ncbi:MAG: hypothetical protein ACYC3X_09320 [Pirellulaceae bacterium]
MTGGLWQKRIPKQKDTFRLVATDALNGAKGTVHLSISDASSDYFESTASPSLAWVKLGKTDFQAGTGVRKLTLVGKPDLAGDQTVNFEQAEPFKFLAPAAK